MSLAIPSGFDIPIAITPEQLAIDVVSPQERDTYRYEAVLALGRHMLSPDAYTPPETTRCGKDILACVDPRRERDAMKSVMQSPGAAVGEVIDIAQSGAIDAVLQLAPNFAEIADAAIEHDVEHRNGMVLDTHRGDEAHEGQVGCKVTDNADRIAGNTAYSSTLLNRLPVVGTLAGYVIDKQSVEEVRQNAARLHHNLQLPHDKREVVGAVSRGYPEHPNVRMINGENKAVAYVLNLTHLALDRNQFHSEAFASGAQVYHDSLVLAVDHINRSYGFEEAARLRRITSRIMRSIATWEVLTSSGPYIPLVALTGEPDDLSLKRIA